MSIKMHQILASKKFKVVNQNASLNRNKIQISSNQKKFIFPLKREKKKEKIKVFFLFFQDYALFIVFISESSF
jgi:hypothetical protein